MITMQQVVNSSAIPYQRFTNWQHNGVIITPANQLIASYRDLNTGRPKDGSYGGWQAHHVLEHTHLALLGVTQQFPIYPLQTSVLIPKEAHERINSMFRRAVPDGLLLPPSDLLDVYADAYRLIGDYSGGGEHAIREELINIVRTQMRMADLKV
jgi:hypothetical protein